MSFRRTFIIALTTLFVIPLAIFMGHGLQLAGMGGAWAGLFLGGLYGLCALGVCWLLLGHWEQVLTGLQSPKLPRRRLLQQTHKGFAEGGATPLARELVERELVEAIDLKEDVGDQWVAEPEGDVNEEVRSIPDALALLRACLAKAEAMPTLPGLGRAGSERFRALSLDNYAIDLRRLFDGLRHESSSATVVVYSREEQRMLFANEVVRCLFGWSPEGFCQRFHLLIAGPKGAWEELVQTLEPHQESELRLVMRTKEREIVVTESTWGLIPSGAFSGLVMGILFTK
jgi:hypothetical protein